MKATEQYFPVVLFIMLYKVVLTFESVDEILKCDHSKESYWAVLSCGTVYYAVQGGSNFWICGWNPKVWPFKWKLLSSTFLWWCFFMLNKVVLIFITNIKSTSIAFYFNLQISAKYCLILAVIKDYGDAFEGFRLKWAPEKSNRCGQTAVRTQKNLKFFCMQGTGQPTRN